jgi:hypothetical protein
MYVQYRGTGRLLKKNSFPGIFFLTIRVVLQRAGAACARPLKGGVWPSLPANASDKKDSFTDLFIGEMKTQYIEYSLILFPKFLYQFLTYIIM